MLPRDFFWNAIAALMAGFILVVLSDALRVQRRRNRQHRKESEPVKKDDLEDQQRS